MFNKYYFTFIWKNYRGLAIFTALLITALQFLTTWIIGTLDIEPVYASFLKKMPQQFQMLFNEEFITDFTVRGAIAFSFNHPIVLTLMGVLAILIPTRHIAGEAEEGTLELLLSLPIKRWQLIWNLFLTNALILFLIVVIACIGSFSAASFFNSLEKETIIMIPRLGLNLWLLYLTIGTFTLMISVLGREGNRIGVRAAGVVLSLYFLHFLGTIWDLIKPYRMFNLFYYYQPQKLLNEQVDFTINILVLGSLSISFLIISLILFQKRDIPG